MVRNICLDCIFVHANNAAANTDADISTMTSPPLSFFPACEKKNTSKVA